MQNIIIGTAGHIDHGKTTLIKALTGRSTDKLAEEIKRGISINLGFTYFDLPSGKRAGIVDVPGHERFIKNMLAGATGIDVVLLTIAANEGIKPQTIEHADILSFLDIKERLIVLTKCDYADDDMKELVKDDIAESLKGTLFDGAEIVEVDSVSMSGIEKLVKRIDDITDTVRVKNDKAPARLNVDRVFSLKGHGTIITGTLSEGIISVGDELLVYPKMLKAKVRSVQVHDQTVNAAHAGQRTALNIPNIKHDEIERGDVLAQPGTMSPTSLMDVKLRIVSHVDFTLKLWDRVRVYMGACEVLARVVPLDGDKVMPGQTAFCQLRLEKPMVAKKNDNFVLRTFSPLITIGGGVVLDANPKKHGKSDKEALKSLHLTDSGGSDTLIEEFIRKNGFNYTTLNDVCSYISMDGTSSLKILDGLIGQGSVLEINKFYFHFNTVDEFNTSCLERLSDYHQKFPLRAGMPKEELKSKTSKLKIKEFDVLLRLLEENSEIKILDGGFVALDRFEISYTSEQRAIKERIEKTLLSAGFSPPPIESFTNGMAKRDMEVFESLLDLSVVKLDMNTAIHKDCYERALSALKDFIMANKEITLAEFRDLTSSSRKYAMLLLDDFDRRGVTMRVGDARVLKSLKPEQRTK